jgi:hypothetical protein
MDKKFNSFEDLKAILEKNMAENSAAMDGQDNGTRGKSYIAYVWSTEVPYDKVLLDLQSKLMKEIRSLTPKRDLINQYKEEIIKHNETKDKNERIYTFKLVEPIKHLVGTLDYTMLGGSRKMDMHNVQYFKVRGAIMYSFFGYAELNPQQKEKYKDLKDRQGSPAQVYEINLGGCLLEPVPGKVREMPDGTAKPLSEDIVYANPLSMKAQSDLGKLYASGPKTNLSIYHRK